MDDMIKIFFGALIGFGGNWIMELIKEQKEKRQLHREKLEQLYEEVNLWYTYNLKTTFNERAEQPKYSLMEMLIGFYEADLLPLYKKCIKSMSDSLPAQILNDEQKKIQYFKLLNEDLKSLKDAIIDKSKRYTATKTYWFENLKKRIGIS